MQCDICGKQDVLYSTLIEGVEMQVCSACSGYGKVMKRVAVKKLQLIANEKSMLEHPAPSAAVSEVVVDTYHILIRNKREQLGLKQEDLAKVMNIKLSLMQHIEQKKFKPNVELAKRFEKQLKIKLVELYREDFEQSKGKPSDALTIGDIIKI